MKAFIVCVDYSDFLQISLRKNRHHFSEIHVITSSNDVKTQAAAEEFGAKVFLSEAFYLYGAVFNKWLPLSLCLQRFAEGWTCVMDADILWPDDVSSWVKEMGNLYTPRRRMFRDLSQPIPPESKWIDVPLPRHDEEFAGYSQIFHSDDPMLSGHPWYQTNWKHAGGADTFFQKRWSRSRKVRPPFEVLHLGEDGVNWCGRVTPFLDGGVPSEAEDRRELVKGFIRSRKGRTGEDRHRGEKL